MTDQPTSSFVRADRIEEGDVVNLYGQIRVITSVGGLNDSTWLRFNDDTASVRFDDSALIERFDGL